MELVAGAPAPTVQDVLKERVPTAAWQALSPAEATRPTDPCSRQPSGPRESSGLGTVPTPLKVAAVQPACTAHDVAHNARVHAETIRAAQARVVVFPELSLTGYELDADAVAVDDVREAVEVVPDAGTLEQPLGDGSGPVAEGHQPDPEFVQGPGCRPGRRDAPGAHRSHP